MSFEIPPIVLERLTTVRTLAASHMKIRSLVVLFLGLTLAQACLGPAGEPLLVVKDGKYGYIDHTGRILIHPQFKWAGDFWRGLGEVYVCGQYVSIDASGAIHPPRIAVPGQLERRIDGTKFGFVDERGQFRIPPAFDDALPFRGGYAAVKVGEKWGFVDAAGTVAIRPQFSSAYYFREGVGTAALDETSVLIDPRGNVLASGFEFAAGIVADGRVPVTKQGLGGYLDRYGRIAVPLIYERVTTFSNERAAVKRAGKWGYIDTAGREVIPLTLDHAGPFGSGLAPARIGNRTGFIDRSGRFVFELTFDQAPGFLTADDEGVLIADGKVSRFWTADGRFGYVNTAGQVIWGPEESSPDHGPLFGWSDAEKVESCQGISGRVKAAVARLFPR